MEIALLLIGLGLGLLLRPYITSYSGEKGKNLATKEDIGEITKKVEDVKSQFSRDLEFVKWQLTKRANIHRIIAEREIQAVSGVADSLVDLRMATSMLRPILDRVPVDEEKAKEVRRERYKIWCEKHDSFFVLVEKQRFFMPKSIYQQLLAIKAISVDEGVSFETDLEYPSQDKPQIETYIKSRETVAAMIKAIDELSARINDRYEIDGLTQTDCVTPLRLGDNSV